MSTLSLMQSEKDNQTKSRVVAKRLKKQSDAFKTIATDVHHGGKNDLIHSIAISISRCKTTIENGVWNGQLSLDDAIELNKLISVPKSNQTLYELLTKVKSAEEYYLPAEDILFTKDQASSSETFRYLRRKFPGFFASENKEDLLRKKWHNECNVLLKPERTPTGWKIDVDTLCSLLRFRYYWLPEEEWWRIYIDGRNYGGAKLVELSLHL